MEDKYIGIDFGMQNLKVCYFDGRKNNLVDLEGDQTNAGKVHKNAVYYAENEQLVLNRFFFGAQQAEEARKYGDADYVRYIKREIQKEKYLRPLCGGKYVFSAARIITDIFGQIYYKMNEYRYEMDAPVVLTVPVIFSEAQKAVLKFCAEKAGFKVKEIITEPFAALFSDDIFDECAADIDDGEEEFTLMFDFGASTLDICLLKLKNANEALSVETVSSTGLSYGGKDITDKIAEYLMQKAANIIQEQMEAGRLDEVSAPVQFFEFAESMKNELYEEEDIPEITINVYGSKLTLKRTNVDNILDESGIWEKIAESVAKMFDATDEFDSDDYDIVKKVVMTGGTSKIQYFRDKMEKMFADAELIGDPEEDTVTYCSVSSGAVNYARKEDILIKNSEPMSVGIDVGKGFEKALNRNSFYNVPGKRKQIDRSTLEKNGWKIKVYQTLEDIREHSDTDNDGILYAGSIRLNKQLYNDTENDIYIRLMYTDCGIAAETEDAEEMENKIEQNIPLTTEVLYE